MSHLMEPCAPAAERTSDPDELARRHWRRNLDALAAAGNPLPLLVEHAQDFEWLFARDGSLTAMEPGERWWGACSLPRRAARFMLKSLDITGTVACFLAPAHAAQLREALGRLEPTQAIVALVPEVRAARVILHADDFADDIGAGRLWFAIGPDWAAALGKLFDEHPGLPTPTQFIRPILADPAPADALIGPAQTVFDAVNERRSARMAALAERGIDGMRSRPRVCVVAPSRFRLWGDAGRALADVLESADFQGLADVVRFDPDRPTSASPLALALALAECDVLVAADVTRADVPALSGFAARWVTWITTPRIPALDLAGPRDLLILADPAWVEPARRAGWPAERIRCAAWPTRFMERPAFGPAHLAIVADTRPIDLPDAVAEFSSQVLMWEAIETELRRNPFALGADVNRYLDAKVAAFGIAAEGFGRELFVDRLIVPAWQQGLARLLVDRGIPVRLHGRGWDEVEALTSHAAGPVSSAETRSAAIERAAALVYAWPVRHAHPMNAAGRPVIYPKDAPSLLNDGRAALRGERVAVESGAAETTLSDVLRNLLDQATVPA